MLRMLATEANSAQASEQPTEGWSDRGLTPEEQLTTRYVLLTLLQDPHQDVSTAEIANRLEQHPHTINLIMVIHTAIGWIQRTSPPAETDWTQSRWRLTQHGIHATHRLIPQNPT
jgi:hypothetical protein